tara:strand:+ start:1096 stop:1227 length:132 start_codon:yes stop_codon:yes gene_type:complete
MDVQCFVLGVLNCSLAALDFADNKAIRVLNSVVGVLCLVASIR